jgi:ABC-type nitrate/sulfonate/bicarbonate transport system substrate-binding protein
LNALEKPKLTLGFIPLTDCAPLVVAHEKGFFARHGLEVTLSKETSWANIRDKLAIGVLDGAQMLAPMVIASHLGLDPIERPVVTALSLDLNGNAVTLSESLYQQLLEIDPEGMKQQPITAAPLKKLIAQRQEQGAPPLTFATVFPFSSHIYLLRYWMAAAGIDPDRDVRLVIIPPPQMASQLGRGEVDGYCVGEPWNAMAVREGLGRVIITGYDIWNNSPEKVLGVNHEWAEQYPNTHLALVTALLEALQWMDQPENRLEVVELISTSIYVNAPAETVRMSMMGTFQFARNEFPKTCPDFNVFHHYAANFPWYSQALWFITQMVRWGQANTPVDMRAIAESAYLPEVYRRAARALKIDVPAVDYKMEGCHAQLWKTHGEQAAIEMGPDQYLDGQQFNPADPCAYLNGLEIAHPDIDHAELKRLNPTWDESKEQSSMAKAIDPEPLADSRGQ